jgi:hypothetical protein
MKAFDHDPGMGPLGVGFERTGPLPTNIQALNNLQNVRIVLRVDVHGQTVIHTAFPH